MQPFQHSPPLPRSTYHLPVVNPGTYPNGGYNTHWGLDHQQIMLYNANQLMGNAPSATGAAATANNDGPQCKWSTGGIPCNQGFADFDGLMEHLGRAHGVQGPAARKLVCQWMIDTGPCGKEYRRDGFRRHIGTHVGLSVLCTKPGCGKSFSRNDSMRAHFKKVHEKE